MSSNYRHDNIKKKFEPSSIPNVSLLINKQKNYLKKNL